MASADSAPEEGRWSAVVEHVVEIWDNLWKKNLWKRILKNVVATTTLVSICLIPGAETSIGRAAYLGAITTVFGHPGRRFGQMAEALILILAGIVLGVGWSTLGVYLGSLIVKDNPSAAYAIRGIFLSIAVLFHGYLRSKTPRLFIFVLLLVISCVVSLLSTANQVTAVAVTQILYPIVLALGVLLVINLCLFPEFSSGFLGEITIETLNDTAKGLAEAGQYFVAGNPSTQTPYAQKVGNHQKRGDNKSDAGAQDNTYIQDTGSPRKLGLTTWVGQKIKGLFKPSKTENPEAEIEIGAQSSVSLADLTITKEQIRKKLEECKGAQKECNFELAVSVLPPRDLKPLSVHAMKKLVANTIAVIGACESKYALVGLEENPKSREKAGDLDQREDGKQFLKPTYDSTQTRFSIQNVIDVGRKQIQISSALDEEKGELEAIKPKREIEFGDVGLFKYLIARISQPYQNLHLTMDRTVQVITACIAYVYDVPNLPSGAKAPKGIILEELDLYMAALQKSLVDFDVDSASALEGAAIMQETEGHEPDIMPREEVFLISSFLLNVRQAVTHIEEMLKHSRDLVQRRQQRHGRLRVYAPHIKWSNWLYTGGEEHEALPAKGRKANRQGASNDDADDDDDTSSLHSRRSLLAKAREHEDLERNASSATDAGAGAESPNLKSGVLNERDTKKKVDPLPLSLRLRGKAADVLEWLQSSEDVLYALKLAFAVLLVSWPGLVASWNNWYSLNRGLWAALQLVLITEVSIGTSVQTFFLRGIGTTLGCLWGWAAVEARNGNRIVCAVMICIGVFPCAYVQLGTKVPKAGMVCIVSMCVVALSTELKTVPGTATENFLKRWIAFMIGGLVALLVEVVILPVKARTRLVESLAAALHQINEMEQCIASGIEEGVKIHIFDAGNFLHFEDASGKAKAALGAAETFLPFCSKEPRIKGSFEGLAMIYDEILFVLHQIVDRMDNMLHLRTAYGSGPLEDLNAEIYPYRRNVAGSITVTLFAIHGALTTKLPLPQFLPSARLAHLRMINRVREVVLEKVSQGQESHEITKLARQRAVRRKYLSWNAASAAQAEIIEYLEELIDLTKLLFGASEFRSGLLTRPTYLDYTNDSKEEGGVEEGEDVGAEARDEFKDRPMEISGLTRRRRGTTAGSKGEDRSGSARRRRGTTISSKGEEQEIPASLKRIYTRKFEAEMKKQKTDESLRG